MKTPSEIVNEASKALYPIASLALISILLTGTFFIGIEIINKIKLDMAEFVANKTAEAKAICGDIDFYYYPCENEIRCENNNSIPNWEKNTVGLCGIVSMR